MANAITKSPSFRVLATKKDGNEVDISDFILRVNTNKSLGSFVGKFTLSLRNRVDRVKLQTKMGTLNIDTIEDFFRPMTYIQIFIKSNPGIPFVPVMRGFVDSVGNMQTAGENGAEDRAVVNGSDMGKIFIKQSIFYREELNRIVASNQQELPVFEGAAASAVAIRVGDFISSQYSLSFYSQDFTPNRFMHEMLNIFIHPYVSDTLKGYNIKRMGESLSGSFLVDNGSDTRLLKLFLANLTSHQGPILNILNFAKNAPWCEIFTQEGADRTTFVYRAIPWRVPVGGGKEKIIPLMKIRERGDERFTFTPVGEGSQCVDAEQETLFSGSRDFLSKDYNNAYFREAQETLNTETRVTLDKIRKREIFRDDADVFTYFRTYPYEHISYKISALDQSYLDPTATTNPFLLRGHTDFFGFKPMEVRSIFYPMVLDAKNPDPVTNAPTAAGGITGGIPAVTPEQQLRNVTPFAKKYLDDFNVAMTDAYRYNPDYEKGTVNIVGDENIKIGQYVNIEVVNGLDGSFYVEAVNHDFTAFGDFVTTLRLSRGTAAINNGNSVVDDTLNQIDKEAIADDKKRTFQSANAKVSEKALDSTKLNDAYLPPGGI